MKHKRHGFTIVELLVVIVVIGILAAVTIVSYSFLSADARTAATVQDMNQLIKTVEVYRAKYGKLPNDSTYMSICLSSDQSACNINYTGTTRMTTQILSELGKVGLTKAPEGKPYDKTYKIGPGLSYNIRTPYINFSASGALDTTLIIDGDVECPIGDKMTSSSTYPTPSSYQKATTCYYYKS